jgi:quercetin dioxygenase-like cupin family protein
MKTLLLSLLLATPFAATISAQDASDTTVVSKASSQKYAPLPGVPDCATLAVLRGDPGKGPSVVEMKFTPGCIIPWHWHSTAESAVPLSGLLEISMKDAKPVILAAGDYGFLPAKHVHQAKCTGSKPCAGIFILDSAFDIRYVDKSGAEIPADQAIAAAQKLMSQQGAKPAPKP